MYSTRSSGPANRLLAELPPDVYARLVPQLTRVDIERRDVLLSYAQPIEHVFFPETMVASLVRPMSDGSGVEAATVGYEGMVGLRAFLGVFRASTQAFAQIGGTGLRMPVEAFRAASAHGPLHDVMGRYAAAFITQVSQSVACNAVHSIRQRTARWLLHTHDRVRTEKFALTQDFLSQMLGVRRATVTETACALQAAGLIQYHYGHVSIVNRPGLEAAACECYGAVVRDYARVVEGQDLPEPVGERAIPPDGGTPNVPGSTTRATQGSV